MLDVDGRAVGALELTDVNPTFLLPVAEPVETRHAVLITALSLSVLRDPAESDPGD